MTLVRKKGNPTQGTLQAIFGVDQTSVCRYLKVMDRILAAVLPTAKNISKEIAECKTVEGFKKRVPGPDGGDITVDGIHCPVLRPSEKSLRRMRYSGKKKQFTNNTNIYINVDGMIIGMSKSFVGSTGDIMLLREDPMPFGRWAESMHDGSIPEEDRIRVWADKGYQGTGRDLPGITLMIPYKRSKNHRILTAEAEGAQPPGQLHQSAGGALYRKDQTLRAPDRPVRWHHRPVQPGIQCDHRACEPIPALGQDRQESAVT